MSLSCAGDYARRTSGRLLVHQSASCTRMVAGSSVAGGAWTAERSGCGGWVVEAGEAVASSACSPDRLGVAAAGC